MHGACVLHLLEQQQRLQRPPGPRISFNQNRFSVFASIEFGDVECAVVAAINTALIASVATGPKISPLLFI